MATINPYLNFDGKAEEAFNFYKSVFGGEFDALMRMKDIPSDIPSPHSDNNLIMHVSLPIGNGSVLMGSDRPAEWGPGTHGDNYYVAIQASSKEEADRLFNGLSAGGKVAMPLTDAFWGAYFGMFIDKFGIQWMVNYTYNQ